MRIVLILALSALPVFAMAAGFDCRKAANDAEKAICSDAHLSAQDRALAAAWKKALAQSSDPGALKAGQRDWLKQRNLCTDDTICLDQSYSERLHALDAPGSARKGSSDWQQPWVLDTDNYSSDAELAFSGTPPQLHFSIEANSGAHSGGIDGNIRLAGDHATYHNSDGCQLDFRRNGVHITVTQKGDDATCGAGAGVYFSGTYIPADTRAAQPQPDLLSLKVVADKAQDQAAHRLLGKDYDELVSDVNLSFDDEDKDGLGASVGTYYVRGIANSNAAIVMHKDQQLWIGLLVFDANNQSRMRYYTNVPPWKKRVPKTLQAWHDSIDKTLPIDLMPRGRS